MTDFAPDITPDAIAAIATRLFNDSRGPARVPRRKRQFAQLPLRGSRCRWRFPAVGRHVAVPGVSDAIPTGCERSCQRIRHDRSIVPRASRSYERIRANRLGFSHPTRAERSREQSRRRDIAPGLWTHRGPVGHPRPFAATFPP